MSFEHVTLAMDLSLSQPGFAVLAITDGKPIVLETSIIKTDAKQSHGHRLNEIEESVQAYLHKYNPEHIVRERGFSRFPAVTQTLFKVVGIVDGITYAYGEKEAHEIAATSVKQPATGNADGANEDAAASDFSRTTIVNTDK